MNSATLMQHWNLSDSFWWLSYHDLTEIGEIRTDEIEILRDLAENINPAHCIIIMQFIPTVSPAASAAVPRSRSSPVGADSVLLIYWSGASRRISHTDTHFEVPDPVENCGGCECQSVTFQLKPGLSIYFFLWSNAWFHMFVIFRKIDSHVCKYYE